MVHRCGKWIMARVHGDWSLGNPVVIDSIFHLCPGPWGSSDAFSGEVVGLVLSLLASGTPLPSYRSSAVPSASLSPRLRFWIEPTPSHTQQFHSCMCWWKPKAWAITLHQPLGVFKHLNMCSRCECYSTRIHRCKKFHINLSVCLLLELE